VHNTATVIENLFTHMLALSCGKTAWSVLSEKSSSEFINRSVTETIPRTRTYLVHRRITFVHIRTPYMWIHINFCT